MSQVPTPVVASRAARYELVDTIASGGMARVYLGRARHGADVDPEPVAVKILHPHLAQEPEVVAMFLDEARVAMRIRHPNVVEVRDVDMVGEDLVIIMEYVEGVALSSMIRALRQTRRSIPVPVVVRIMVAALRGLHAAHEMTTEAGEPMRIVHRDVSPHNVLVGINGESRVTDFGIATSVGRLAQTRTGGGVRGKLQYLAPEQIHRKAPDRRVDVWAAGLVLWECLTGKRLFDAGTEAETIAETLRAPISPPSMLRVDVPLGLDDTCLRALERDPARRFATAAAFADALENDSEVELATPEQVAAVVQEVGGAELAKRRESFVRGPTTPVVLPSRFSLAVPSTPPAPVSAPVGAATRGNKLALVAVASISVVIGGLGVRFAGTPADVDVRDTASAPMRAAQTAETAAAQPIALPAAASATPPTTPPEEGDAAVIVELPASAPAPAGVARTSAAGRAARPVEKKRPPAKTSSSTTSGRPFMPADL